MQGINKYRKKHKMKMKMGGCEDSDSPADTDTDRRIIPDHNTSYISHNIKKLYFSPHIIYYYHSQ